MKKIVIFGAGGMIGKSIRHYHSQNDSVKSLITLENYTKSTMNIYEEYINGNISNTINKILDGTDFVVNCIGMVKCSKNKMDEYLIVNSVWAQILGRECDKRCIKMINISTDYIFDEGGDNLPDSIPTSSGIYGITKYLGEYHGCANIRTSVIGENNNGRGIIEWAKRKMNGTVEGNTNQIWNGVTSYDIGKYIVNVILGEEEYWKGVKHVVSFKEGISKFDLISAISDVYNLNIKVVENDTSSCHEYIRLSGGTVISNDFNESLRNTLNINKI